MKLGTGDSKDVKPKTLSSVIVLIPRQNSYSNVFETLLQ